MAATHPISVRLAPEVDKSVRRLARQTRRPLGRVVNDLLDQRLRMQRFPGIVFMDGPRGVRAHLYDTGLDVWEFISLYRAYGCSLDALQHHHPHLSQHHVDTALAYAVAYPDEIEGAIAQNERPIEEVLRENPHIRVVEVQF
jgi:uncharacterized protein (DUF433 family)